MGGDEPEADLVTFGCHGFRFALEAEWVRSLLFNGEVPLPKVSLEQVFCLSVGDRRAAGRCLVVAAYDHMLALEVEEPVRLVRVLPGAIHRLPPLIQAQLPPNIVKALYLDEEGMSIICDVAGLVAKIDVSAIHSGSRA